MAINKQDDESKSRPTTRQRILLVSLQLFNEQGEPNTTTNEIANASDISPGNLHYHFRKKSELVGALLLEFQADARRVLRPPESVNASLEDFWVFLHLLLECTAAYRFLFRDMESLIAAHPKVGKALKNFAKGLAAVLELHLSALASSGVLILSSEEVRDVRKNLAVIALFSERFDELIESSSTAEITALRTARSILDALRPFISAGATEHLQQLSGHYDS